MGWFFRKKQIPQEKKDQKKKEVQVLEQVEEKIVKNEIKICEKMIHKFSEASHLTYIWHEHAHKGNWITINAKDIKKFKKLMTEAQEELLNLKGCAKKTKKLSEKLENDLLDIRDGTHDEKVKYFSESEHRVLTFNRELLTNIDQLIQQIKVILGNDLKEVENTGYCSPKNSKVGEKIRKEIIELNRGLNGLHKMLLDLFELEKKVEELTVAYINT